MFGRYTSIDGGTNGVLHRLQASSPCFAEGVQHCHCSCCIRIHVGLMRVHCECGAEPRSLLRRRSHIRVQPSVLNQSLSHQFSTLFCLVSLSPASHGRSRTKKS